MSHLQYVACTKYEGLRGAAGGVRHLQYLACTLIMRVCGELQVAFLFTDSHVADEGFLELLNTMLTTGMPAALFDDAEKDALVAGIRDEVPLK